MENGELDSSCGRAELVTALDNLCAAIGHLITAAEAKLVPSIAPEVEQLNLEFVPSSVPTDDDVVSGFGQFEFALSSVRDTAEVSAKAATNSMKTFDETEHAQEPMFANRLVELQSRLGGFLK